MYKILLIILVLFNISSYSQDAPKTKLYAVSDGSCCGGEESDPHAVHGIEAINNGFILSGKSIDQNGTEEGFVVKFPSNMPDEKIFLHPEDEYSFDWTFTFGSQGKRDGANGSAIIDNSVFVSGYSENEKGVINKYLAMLDLVDGKLKWEKFYQSKNKNSAFESILATSDNGIILSGVNNADKESFEGFKSYGNPQSGEAFVMFFDKNSLIAENGPSKATWEITIKNSISGITIKENIRDKTFVIASASTKEPRIAKITKIDKNGKIIWNKSYPNLAEITDLDISYNNENPDGYLISGHKSDTYDGIDGTLTKLSLDGSIIWNNMFGNPIGGNNKFSSVTDKNEKMVFDECWGISSTLDGGAVMACGTGIEECELFENNDELFNKCSNDPRTTWRSLLIRVDNNGKKIWEHLDSFTFPEEEDDFDVPSTASEYVFITKDNNIASVIDLGFGIGLQILESENK